MGHWIEFMKVIIPEPYNKWEQAWKCSECGFDDGFIAYNYCPNCGGENGTGGGWKMNEWISVKDRLPEIDGNVLVIVNGRPHKNVTLESAYELGEFSQDEGWILEMWPEWETPDVTHWMPLPEPPEEAEAALEGDDE